MYRAAIIGLGQIAWRLDNHCGDQTQSLTHAAALGRNGQFRLMGGVSPDQEDRQAFADRFLQVPTFATCDEMLETLKPNLVSICSPSEHHYEHALSCLEREVPMIWLEKPPAHSLAKLDHLIEVQAQWGGKSKILVNYIRRYMACYRRLRSLYQDQVLGRCLQIHINYSRGLELNGSHILDVLFFLVGEEASWRVEWVSTAQDRENPSFALSLENGVEVLVSGLSLPYHCIDITLVCEGGRAAILYGGLQTRLEKRVEHEMFPGYYRLKPSRGKYLGTGGFGPFMDKALEDLLQSHQEGRQPLSNLSTARSTQAVMAEVRQRQKPR